MAAAHMQLGTELLAENIVGGTAESSQVRLEQQGAVRELGRPKNLRYVDQVDCTSVEGSRTALQWTSWRLPSLVGSRCRIRFPDCTCAFVASCCMACFFRRFS